MTISIRRLSTIFLVLLIAVSPLALAKAKSPWTQFRGPSAEGPSTAGDLPTSKFGLSVAWTRDLGSGYSTVWTTKDKAVTMFTAGEVDVVAAFDLASGDEIWRYELGQKYCRPRRLRRRTDRHADGQRRDGLRPRPVRGVRRAGSRRRKGEVARSS